MQSLKWASSHREDCSEDAICHAAVTRKADGKAMPFAVLLSILVLALLPTPADASDMTGNPIIIAHRGASASRPEHTLAAYKLAIEQGADFIEPDLVPTKDGHLVARHENEISGTTDIADHPIFADRRTTKTIDGQETTGWFTEDFTLAELKTLRARERLPALRPSNMAFDGQEQVPTFEEIIALVKGEELRLGRRIGLYPETKHPSYFAGMGLEIESRLLRILIVNGYTSNHDPVFIQSFEVTNLQKLRKLTKLRLIQLVAQTGGPADLPGIRYQGMLTLDGLSQIATYADGIGPEKSLIIPRTTDGALGQPTALVASAKAAGLVVHAWTFRPENHFLPTPFRTGGSPADQGRGEGEIRAFIETGVDGIFTDSVPAAARAMGRNLP